MPSPILARADALMQRRRPSGGELDEIPVLTDAIVDDDDIPVLLDVEIQLPAADAEPPPDASVDSRAVDEPPRAPPAFDAALRDILAHELARRVEQRIAAELPRIIKSTVRDFLAEQEMIAALQPRD